MDPLSLMASVAGVATAGIQLSKAIYHLMATIHGASREMKEIARTIADLSTILGELRRVLRDGADLCSRRSLRQIKSTMRRISRIHDEVYDMMDGIRSFAGLKWMFKRSEVQDKLARIESYKTGIQLMLNILVLAITTRKYSKSSGSRAHRIDQEDQRQKQEQEQDIQLLRQQSENLAFAARQSLADLSSQNCDADPEESTDAGSDQGDETSTQLQVYRQRSDDTANWLFDLVFSSYAQSCADASVQEEDRDSTNSDSSSATSSMDEHAQEHSSKNSEHSTSHKVVPRGPAEMKMAIYEPGAASSLVKELIADWTLLTEKEIESITSDEQSSKEKEAQVSAESKKDDRFIQFKDAVGRKFKFPFHRVKTWEGMKTLITSAFVQVDVLGPHVLEGHYDLVAPEGDIILPEIWEDIIEPDMAVTMTMWPMDKLPPVGPKPLQLPMGGMPPPGGVWGEFFSGKRPAKGQQPKQPPLKPDAPTPPTPEPPSVTQQTPQTAARRSPENDQVGGGPKKATARKKHASKVKISEWITEDGNISVGVSGKRMNPS
ncbi:hypothetical protein B0T10DRAFT_258214 [Thelonectria olida]|uniref:Ubiquitin-like domain-containing protein n=1 Tax=Thelonectria olida TaxID=1576542 RepID=A0A9P8WB88_9HYPO|nr:hypothetical protein B0T10DRAFT_258214 [Thelonectria olida]